jgi:phosphoglycerate dehydrogenase-like enzyme
VTAALQAEPDVDLTIVRSFDELAAKLAGAAALVMSDPPPERGVEVGALLRACAGSLRWIHITNAGRDGLDAAGVPDGIGVSTSAGANAQALAEHIMAFMLAFTRRMPEFANATRARTWDVPRKATMGSIEGQTLAIVGLGYAGRALAKSARVAGMNVIAVRHEPLDDPLVDEVYALADLHAALGKADFIALTVALTPQTHHLFGRAEFAACKPMAYLVNVARGGVLDQVALAAALRAGTIAGAGLDVAEPEPLPPDDPLWDAPNLIVTPHCAGSTSPMTLRRMGEYAAASLANVRGGR